MKKFLLLLTLLVSFGGMVHAEEKSITLNASSFSISGTSYATKEKTIDGITFAVHAAGGLGMNKGKGCYLAVTGNTNKYTITSVTINFSAVGAAGKISLFKNNKVFTKSTATTGVASIGQSGLEALATYSKTSTNTSTDYSIEINDIAFGYVYTSTTGNQFKINSIVVKYSTGGPQDYAAEFTKEGFKVDLELETKEDYQLNLGAKHPSITFSSNNEDVAIVYENGYILAIGIGTTAITASWATDSNWNGRTIEFPVTVTKPLQDAGLAYSAAEATALLGEAFDAPVLSNPNNLAVTYTSSDEKVATINADGIVTIGGAGTTTIKATFAGNEEFRAAEASYTLTVTKPRPAGAIEEALLATTNFGVNGVTSQTYQDFTYKSPDTGIDYLAFLSGGASQEFFQIRTDKSQSGIVIKANKNGYVASSISIEWAPRTSDSRTLELYGKHKAYSAPSELFATATQGTLLKKFAKTETEFNLNGEYNFIGLRSTTGVIYLSKITITWVPAAAPEVPVVEGFSEGTAMSVGDQITIKGKPGQHLHYIIEKNAQFAMNRAAATEGWTPAESHEYTYTLATEDLPVKIRAKAVNGAGTHESEEVAFGIDSDNTPTGVEAIEAEDNEAEVEWFNLQGVRVENPAAGLYIRRQGNKVEKVVVK